MTQLIIGLGGLCGAIITIAALVKFVGRPLWRGWQRVDAFLEDWNGTPARPGKAAVPSIPARVTDLEAGLADVQKQVTPNGGNTKRLGDRVVRLEQHFGTSPEQNGG